MQQKYKTIHQQKFQCQVVRTSLDASFCSYLNRMDIKYKKQYSAQAEVRHGDMLAGDSKVNGWTPVSVMKDTLT
jgi:hypothetical protein